MLIKLASWNLHRYIGRDGVKSVERCAQVLQEMDADIIALQEVDSRPGHIEDELALLAQTAGYQAIASKTMIRENRHYGNALFTRLPVQQVVHHDLTLSGREPRAALDAEFEIAGFKLQFMATHLGLRPFERRKQVEKLISYVDSSNYDIVVLAGDFNEWFLWGRPLRQLHAMFADMPHCRTWPSYPPLFALDRIWVKPRSVLHKLTTHRSATSRVASDHLPVIASIGIG